jgi:bifunctional non-homologous end joining protein LigD
VSLREYKSKRHFSKTPEPEGVVRKAGGPLRFVVQKHAATRLHYDFRLELGGALKSWAVPKGPSLNPEDKRLAMMVEDHPLDYAHFEGTIPKGNYGAGTVMVWDEGTYHVPGIEGREDNEAALQKALEKGDLKLSLQGEKLRGTFALFKLKRGEPNAWLLVKKHDEFATDKPVTDQDFSVVTGRNLEQIANGEEGSDLSEDDSADLSDAPQAVMPRNVKPMLASPVDKPFDHPDWVFEIKWDGYRAIAEVEKGQVRLYSRRNLSLQDRFPSIVESVRQLGHDAVLDGEVVVLDQTGKAQFQLLQGYQKLRKGVLVYYVFDLLYLDGHDLRKLPLLRRKKLLSRIVKDLPNVRLSDHIAQQGRAFFDAAAKKRLEGIVGKLAGSTYVQGQRSRLWIKIKTHLRQEAVIGGFTEERRNRNNLGALLLGVYEGGDLVYIGHAGSGFTRQTLADLRGRLEPLIQKQCPFKRPPKANAKVHWVRPELVCEVSFTLWTDDGNMRNPVFEGLRDDVVASNVKREESEDPGLALKESQGKTFAASQDRPSRGGVSPGVIRIGGHSVSVTNRNKVYWPAEGYTKGDLIDYYQAVSRYILPHLKDRPQSLHRHPNGILKQSFFQKDFSNQRLPEWVATIPIPSDSGDKIARTIVCQDEATLVYLANLGCIEINPWNACVQSLDQADYVLLDLDPEDIEFPHLVEAAQEIRKLMERAGAASYCKTSGKRGLHVYIPFGARYSHEQAKQFAYVIAQIVHGKRPATTSLVRAPGQRQKRVYLDFLQNGKGKTLAAPYSARPYPGATVSTPLQWKEVNKRLDPSRFTIRTLPERLAKLGDIWEPVLGPGIDLQKCLEGLSSLLRKA